MEVEPTKIWICLSKVAILLGKMVMEYIMIICVCVYVYIYIHIQIHVYIYTYIQIHIYMCVCDQQYDIECD